MNSNPCEVIVHTQREKKKKEENVESKTQL